MLLIRSLLFYLIYYGTLIPHALLCVFPGILLPIKLRYKYFLIWNAASVWLLSVICGVKFQVKGKENVPDGAFVLLSNHQSPWETLYLYYSFLPITAILKKELLKIPFFGWGLWLLEPIAIDRNKKGKALQQLLEQGKKKLEAGISVLVFPEGTRVAPGKEKKYSAGGAELAISAGALIVPVAHNAGLFWPAHKLIKHPGTVQVVIGKPINPAGRNAKEVTQEVEAWIRQAI